MCGGPQGAVLDGFAAPEVQPFLHIGLDVCLPGSDWPRHSTEARRQRWGQDEHQGRSQEKRVTKRSNLLGIRCWAAVPAYRCRGPLYVCDWARFVAGQGIACLDRGRSESLQAGAALKARLATAQQTVEMRQDKISLRLVSLHGSPGLSEQRVLSHRGMSAAM